MTTHPTGAESTPRTQSEINPTVCPKCEGNTALIQTERRVWRWQCAECDWGRMVPVPNAGGSDA